MVVLFYCMLAVHNADVTANQMVDRYELNLKQVFSLRARIVGSRSTDGGESWNPMYEIDVRRSGQRERVDQTLFGILAGETWREGVQHLQSAFSPEETRNLSGVDPKDPPRRPLEGQAQLEVTGAISAPTLTGPHGRNVNWCQFLLLIPDVRYSLRQLIEQSTAPVPEPVDSPVGSEAWRLEVAPPEGGYSYVVTILPDRGHLIGELVSRFRDPAKPRSPAVEATSRVLEFSEPAPGLWFPKRIRTTYSDKPDLITEVVVEEVRVNEPIRDADLALEFPRGAVVVDEENQDFHLWGKGGPGTTFASVNEFAAWRDRMATSALRRDRPLKWLPVTALVLASVAIVLLFVIRSRLRRNVSTS